MPRAEVETTLTVETGLVCISVLEDIRTGGLPGGLEPLLPGRLPNGLETLLPWKLLSDGVETILPERLRNGVETWMLSGELETLLAGILSDRMETLLPRLPDRVETIPATLAYGVVLDIREVVLTANSYITLASVSTTVSKRA